MYTVYFFTQGRVEGGGGELTEEKAKGAIVHKAYMTDCIYQSTVYKLY
jgi:hypothetical protein